MSRKPAIAILLIGAAIGLSAPALAEVKAGVDAWTRGDFAVAAREWQGPAKAGDADAQFNLGQAYKLGRGVKQDIAKAEDLFRRAAAQGHLQASDTYGLLLFQRGERAAALPYIRAGADRGDPRAQYLLGIAHFNGDYVPKDWVRAYALVSLAQQAGLDQARLALVQMDQYVALDQRQQGVALAAELDSQAQATRGRQLAAVDLGNAVPIAGAMPQPALRAPTAPLVTARPAIPAPTVTAARDAVAAASRVAGSDSPRTAGADYARPAGPSPQVATAKPRPVTAALAPVATGGAWRVQLGAFGLAANADALWGRVRARPELAGHPRVNVSAGGVIKLQAGGFASHEAARAACARLASAGVSCLAVRN